MVSMPCAIRVATVAPAVVMRFMRDGLSVAGECAEGAFPGQAARPDGARRGPSAVACPGQALRASLTMQGVHAPSRRIHAKPARALMHRYRSHTCGALRLTDAGQSVRLSGWCHRIRDHGGLLFIDLRDHYGLTQCVADPDSPAFKDAERLRAEWVVRVDGKVRRRPAGTENPDLPTGAVELFITEIEVLGPAAELPMPVFGDQDYPEETRLTYRFLDLRRDKLHRNLMTRSAVIDDIRNRMRGQGFSEFQ